MNRAHQNSGKYSKSCYGYYVAYHFFVGRNGKIVQTRCLSDRSGHTRNQATNLESISIVLAGNFEKQQVTRGQARSLDYLIKKLHSIYDIQDITGHKQESPTKCPGKNLMEHLIKRGYVKNEEGGLYLISRYYTPVPHQKRYYRSYEGEDLLDVAMKYGIIVDENGTYIHKEEAAGITFARRISEHYGEVLQLLKTDEMLHYLVKRATEYRADFEVNCQNDCLKTANGFTLKPEHAMRVAACPPEMPLGTRLRIDGLGEVTCVDRGGAIKGKQIDLWTGIGDEGLNNILGKSIGKRHVSILSH